MSQMRTTVRTEDGTVAYIKADIVTSGVDSYDTYAWEWGIDHDGAYLVVDAGLLQHRECDGMFKLLALVLQKAGIRL